MRLRDIIQETASAGSTSSGSVATTVSTKKPSSRRKNKDGTVKNAVDTNDNIFGNTNLKR